MAQHADAMRDIFRCLAKHVFRGHGISADDFVGSDADAQVFVAAFNAHGGDDYMLGQKTGATAFGHGDVNKWNDCAAQIKNSHQVAGTERKLGDDRPLKNFFDVEDWKAKAFAAAIASSQAPTPRWAASFLVAAAQPIAETIVGQSMESGVKSAAAATTTPSMSVARWTHMETS